jgi:hypothetical protein
MQLRCTVTFSRRQSAFTRQQDSSQAAPEFDRLFAAHVYSGRRGYPSIDFNRREPRPATNSRVVRAHEGRLAQLVRAPALQAGGRRFESCTAHQPSILFPTKHFDRLLATQPGFRGN